MKYLYKIYLLVFCVSLFLTTFSQAQTVNFSSTITQNGCNIATYDFISTYLDAGGDPPVSGSVFYHWDFGNGTQSSSVPQSTDANTQRVYTAPGQYNVRLRVYDGASFASNLLAQRIGVVTVFTNASPDFSADQTNGCIPYTVTLTDLTDYTSSPLVGAFVSRTWNFGDGNTTTVTNPATTTVTHTYTNPGDFQITLTTRTSGGRVGEECVGTRVRPAYIRVRHTPIAGFTVNSTPAPCTLPFTPQFTNTSTIATTPTPAGSITSYIWRFYTDATATTETSFSPITRTTAAPPTLPAGAYSATGTYAVSLTAISSTGCTNTFTNNSAIVITNPTADFSPNALAGTCAAQGATFTDTSTDNPVSWNWNFPGATPATSSAQNPTVTYNAAGTFNVTLTATYANGCTRTVSKPYTVRPLPNATFSVIPVDGYCNAPKTVQFVPNIANQPGYTFFWNFGETNNAGLNPGPTSTAYSPTNLYELYGDYDVSLTVTDPSGCTTTFVDVLQIIEPIVTIAPRTPVQGCAPLDVTYDFTASAIEPITRYTIDYGDGTVVTFTSPPTPLSIPANQTHTYNVAGTYTASIEIETINGCVKKVFSSQPIQVGEPPTISSVTVVNGGGTGCRGPLSFTPVFAPGVLVDSVSYDYGEGAPFGTNTAPYNATYTFAQNGTRTLTVRAFYNGCPMLLPYTQNITIDGPIANLAIVGNADICTGSNEACFNILGSLPATSGAAATTYSLAFGDGTVQTGNLSDTGLGNICHTYSTPASYPVTLTLSGNGCNDNVSTTITISTTAIVNYNVQPNPAVSCSVNQITFTSTSASSSSGVSVVEYIWDYDDGVIDNLPAPGGATTTHTYIPRNTPYNPSLSIRLSNGCVYSIAPADVKSVNIQGPIPTITGLPSLSGCTTVPVSFQGNATIVPGGNAITNWFWDFGDPASGVNNTSSLQNPSHTFVSPGTYTITLRVKDNNTLPSGNSAAPGCEAIATATVQVFAKPAVSFTQSQAVPCVGSGVDFNLTTNAGAGATYVWDFGDGGTSTEANPNYAFASIPLGTSATRVVSVTVTSVNGCATTFSRNITVANPDLVITANGSAAPITISCPPSSVNFTSTITPSVVAGSGWTYQWDFGDGNQANTPNATNDYIAPNAPSIFNVTLIATNNATGCSVTKNLTAFVTINGPRGTFDFSPKIVCYPQTVTFQLTSQQGSPTQIEWDHGDGTTSGPLALPGGATHTYTYTKSGNFLPIMTLYNSTGCKIGYPSTVGRVLSSGPPSANFTWTGGGQICRDVTVNFTDQSSPDPLTNPGAPLNPQVNRWTWTIYDGQNDTDPILAVYNTQNPSHVFTQAKSYKVRLSVLSAFNQGGTPDGCPSTIDKEITIVEPSVTAAINSILPAQRCPGEIITFTGSGTTSVSPSTLTYQWRFFNRTGGPIEADTTGVLIGVVNGAVATFSFPDPGTYVAKLVVRDVALCTGGAVSTTEVVVDPLPTFAPSSGPDNLAVCVGENASFTVIASASALAAPGVTYQWQVNDGGGWADISNGATLGGAVYGGTTTDNLTITASSFNLNTYQYRCIITKQNTTACQAISASATLTVNQNATTAVINPPVNPEVCDITTYTLSANAPTVGTGTWTKLAGSPAGGTITNPNDPNSEITSLQYGLYTYRWTISNGVCPPTFADFTIRNVRPAFAGTDQNLCNATSFTLAANDPVASGNGVTSTGQWTVVSGPNTPTVTPINSPNATVTGVIASTTPYVFRWTITGSSACGTSSDEVSIINSPLPTVVNPLPQTVCVGQSATFSVSGAPTLQYQWQEDNGSGSGFVDLVDGGVYSGVSTQTLTISNPNISFNTFRYRVLVTNTTTTCSNTSSAAELTVFPTQTDILTASPTGPVCEGTNVTFSLSSTTIGYTYQLRVGAIPVSGVPVINGNGSAQSFIAFTPTTTNTYNVLVTTPTANGVNCQQQLASTAAVTVSPTPTISAAGPNKTVCAASTTLSANVPTSGTGTWVRISGAGNITAVNNPNSNVNALGIGDNVFEWRISSGACTTSSSQMTITRLASGNVAVAGPNQNICAPTTTLNANTPINGGVGTWTTSGIANIDDPNSPNSSVSNLAVGANIFTWTIVDACGTTTSSVTITREEVPTAAVTGPNQNLCNTNTTTLIANTSTSGNGRWFITAGFGVFADDTDPNTDVSNLADGVNTFEWRISNSCGTSSDFVDVLVSPTPSVAVAGMDQTFCGTSTVMNATVPTIGTGTWTLVSGAGVINNPNSATTSITGLDIGLNVFRWTVGNGLCASTFDEVTITRETNNTFAYAGPNQILCGTQVTLTANTPSAGTNFYWTLAPGTTLISGTLGVAGGANGTPTITVNGMALGANTFRWTVTNSCATSISDVTITRVDNTTIADAGTNQTVCTDNITLQGNTPTVGTGTWSTTMAGVSITNPNAPNTTITGLPLGNTTFTWTINNGACTPTTSNVVITRRENITGVIANASATTVCANTVDLTGSTPDAANGETGTWTVITGTATVGTPSNPSITINNLSDGLNTFRWTVANASCTPVSADISITKLTEPIASNAGPNQSICADTYTLNGNVPAVGTGTWSLLSGPTAVSFGNINAANTTVSGLTGDGIYVFQWEITNPPCASSQSTVSITRNGNPDIASAGAAQDVCGSTATLAGNNPTIGTGTWTVIQGGGTVDFPAQFNSTVSGLTPGVNRFRWTISNGTCTPTTSEVTINSFENPSAANAGADNLACAADGILSAVPPTIGTGTWTRISGSGSITSPNSPSTAVTGLALGDNVFRWTVSNGICPSAANFDEVTLTRRGSVSLSVAGVSETICGNTYTLNANTVNTAQGETGTWTAVGGTIAPADLNNPNATATNLQVGVNAFTWTVNNGCATSVSTVFITREDNTTAADAGNNQNICNNSTTLAANQALVGAGQWAVVSVPAPLATTDITFDDDTKFNAIASGMTAPGNYVLRWTITNNACVPAITSTSNVTITREELPTTSIANPLAQVDICTDVYTMQGNTPTVGSGNWSLVSGNGTFVGLTSNPNVQLTNVGIGINVFKWTITNGSCPVSESTVIINRATNPTIAAAGSAQSICENNTTMDGNTPIIGQGTWAVQSVPAPLAITDINFSSVNDPETQASGFTAAGNYVLTWTINNPGCPPTTSTVTVTRTSLPLVADAGTSIPICTDDLTLAGNTPGAGQGTGTWTVISQVAGTNIVFNNANLGTTLASGFTLPGNYTLRWTIANGNCPPSISEIVITRTSPPTVANAGINQSICESTTTLAGNLPSVGIGTWSVVNQPPDALVSFANAAQNNSVVNGMTAPGNYVFEWRISNAPCSPSFATVTITRTVPPSIADAGGPYAPVCVDDINLNAATPAIGMGQWSVVSQPAGTNVTFSNPGLETSSASGLTLSGNYVLKWAVSNGQCPVSESTIVITRQASPTIADAGTNQSICESTTTLAGNLPAIGIGTWSVVNQPPDALVSFANAAQNNTVVNGMTRAGDYVFRWTITNGACPPSIADVTITRTGLPTVADAGGPYTPVCGDNITLNGNTPTVGIGTWSVISQPAGANVNFGNANLPNTTANGMTLAGTYTFKWTISNGNCPVSESTTTVTREALPSVANAGANQNICADEAILAANTPSVGIGTWSVVSEPAGATTIFANANQANTTASGLTFAGNYVLRWTIANASCPVSISEITITRANLPSPSIAGIVAPTCADNVTMAATPVTLGVGTWSVMNAPSGSAVAFVNANDPTTPVNGLTVAGNYVFKWTTANGTCPSNESTVTVIRQANPSIANAGTNQSICESTTTLAGNLPAIGIGTWSVVNQPPDALVSFANAAQNNTVVNGMTRAGDYVFRWTITNGACPPSIADVTITRTSLPTVADAGGPYPAVCGSSTSLNAVLPTIGIGTWTIVNQPTGANVSFSNPNLNSTTINGLDIAGTYTFKWTVSNGNCPSSESFATLVRESAPSVSIAGNDQTICGTTATLSGNVPSVGTGMWTSSDAGVVFSNASSASSGVSNLSVGTTTFTWTISNGTCPSSVSTMTITRLENPSTSVITTASTSICTDTQSLSATAPTVGNGVWSVVSAPIGATVTFTNTTSNNTDVNGLTLPGAYILKWTVSNGTCPPSESTVTITREASPSLANAGNSQSICESTATLSGNTPSVGVGTWSVVSGTATIVNPNQANSQVTGLGIGENILRWTISNGTCTPSTSDVSITRETPPTVSNAGLNTSTCDNSFGLSANIPTDGVGAWSVESAPSGANVAFNNTSLNTATVSGLTLPGNYIFKWTISNGTCPPSESTVTITREASPSLANAGINQNTCANSITLNANVPNVGVGTWSIISQPAGASTSFTNINQNNSSISGLNIAGGYILRWTISNGACTPSTSDVVITRDPAPTPSVITTVSAPTCVDTQTLNANAVSVGTGTWSVVSVPNGAAVSFTNINANNTTANGLTVAGNYIFKWTVSNGGCPNSESTITITREAQPSVSNAGINQNTCASSITLNANVPTIGIGTWAVISQPVGANASFGNLNQNNTNLNGLTVAGNYTLRWTISSGTCTPSTSEVSITKEAAPSQSNAGANQVICATSLSLNGNIPTNGTGMWSVVSAPAGAVATFNNANANDAIVSGLTVSGNYVFKWTISNGTCPASESTVTITKEAAPTTANAGNNQVICANNITLNGNVPNVGVGTWSIISQPAGANALIINPSQNNTTVSGLSVSGNYILRWSISNGNCTASTSDVTIIKEASPTLSNAGANQSICANEITLNGNMPTVGTGTWSVVSAPTGTAASFNNANLNNATVSALTLAGTYVFKWSISNGNCANSESTVTITKDASPSIANAGTNQFTCVDALTLNANAPAIGVGAWSVVSQPAGAMASFTNINQNNTSVNNLTVPGTYVLRWTVSNGSCASSSSDVSISREVSPTTSNAGVNETICQTSYILNANVPSIGTGTWSVVSVPAGAVVSFSNANQHNATVNSLSALGTYVFKWTISNGICPPSESTVTITRETGPSPADAGLPQTVCTTNAFLIGNNPALGTGIWTVETGGATILNPNSPTTQVTNLSIGPNVFRWTISGTTCPPTSSLVTVTRLAEPTTATVDNNFSVCESTATLNGNTPTVGSGQWIVVSGGASINTPNSPTTQVSNLSVGANVFKWVISNGSCAPSEASITVTRESANTTANAGQPQSLCTTAATLMANNPSVGAGVWTVESGGATIVNPNSPITQVTNLGVGANIFRWTINSATCPSTFSLVTITRFAEPTVATVDNDFEVCTTTATLNGNTPTVGIGQWMVVSGGASVNSPNNPTSQVSNLSIGANVFKWVISNGNCTPTEATITITRLANPSPANAGQNQEVCATTATLSANNPSVGTGQWTVVSGSASINSPNSFNTGVTNLSVGDNVFRWTVSNGICPVSESTVTITRYAVPTVANAGADISTCGASSITLDAVPATVGVGLWTQLSGPSNAIIVNGNAPNTQINGLIGGIYTFRWRVSNGVCAATQDEVTVTVVPNPNTSANLVVQDLTICEAFQQNINISVSNTQAGVTYELRDGAVVLSAINSSGGTITFTIPSPTTSPAPSTTYTYDVYAVPAALNNVQCPPSLLIDKAIITVDVCNNPIANNLFRTTDFCTLLSTNVITATENGNDPDNFRSEPISNFVTLAGGVVNMDFEGNFTYLPRTDFVGVDSLSYTICNTDVPARCSTGKVYITILPCTNEAPVAKDDSFNTDDCTVIRGNALDNDTDAEGNILTVAPSNPILTAAGGVFDIQANGAFEYTPRDGFVGQDSITYTVCDNGDNGTSIVKCDEGKIYFNVVACENVFVPDGFSPNGDGINDTFVIVGAERYDILLRVYNRWGNLLYESDHYLNDWDGRPNRGILSNNAEGLPDGTYFYIADFRDGKKPRTSYLIIQR